MPNDFLEKSLEDIIYENRGVIHTRGFMKVKSTAFRQVVLPSGKRIDILGFEISNGNLYCDIYELKKAVIDADAICQAYNYFTELKYATKGHFVSFNAQIIMVGKKYEPVSILDALPIKIQVYTYEYKMDGIQFKELHNPYVYSEPSKSFSLGLWAFGYAGLSFNEDRSSINFHTTYENYSKSNPGFNSEVIGYVNHYSKQLNLLPAFIEPIESKAVEKIVYKYPNAIKTEIFPEQPQWNAEFENGIPHVSLCDDFQIVDDLEMEDDELEQDFDYEDTGDAEYNDVSVVSGSEFRRSEFIEGLIFVSIIDRKEYYEYFRNLKIKW